MRASPADLAEQVRAGSHQAAARLISLLEDGDPEGLAALRALPPEREAYTVGITGPPGAGKSTLVDALTRLVRAEGATVGIIAVDPTSPFTGGALLGDRIRMQEHSTDPGVFVRSMATRGHLGGLAPATLDAARVLAALGVDLVLVETVGAGQAEVDVVTAADTVVVVAVPGMGDALQTLKAGIMEIGDVFAVNKADRPDADRTVVELRMMLHLAPQEGWRPPVVRTVATMGEGVAELLAAVRQHRAHLEASEALEARRRRRRRQAVLRALEARVQEAVLARARHDPVVAAVLEEAERGVLDARAAADRLLQHLERAGW